MKALNPSGRAPILGDVSHFDCVVTDEVWEWAQDNAAAIAAHWEQEKAAKPDLFNGRILLATEVGIEKSTLVSRHCETDYAALLYWRSLGCPRADAFNLFGAGLVVTADGAVLLGRMAAHTANAGQCYFPCGTPDPADVRSGRLDIESSILREMMEETGLGSAHLTPADERWISWDGPIFCCARRLDCALDADETLKIVEDHLAAQAKAELDAVYFVRSMDEAAHLHIPAYALALLGQILD